MPHNMTNSHSDKHDLDKLTRWYGSMSTAICRSFPVHIIFLVFADDKAAHEIFRKFRSSFDKHSTRFDQLVIFGQHGVSSTVNELLSKFGLNTESLPMLIMFERPSANIIYQLPITSGTETNDDGRWMDLLTKVEQVADKGGSIIEVASLMGIVGHRIDNKSIYNLVFEVLKRLA